jgi:AcrR family transcriptional regulator
MSRKPGIVERALQIAAREGVGQLTIGRLAKDLGMSKSGVFGHFGSSEQLQVEIVEAGLAAIKERVWRPAAQSEPGLPRLQGLCWAWLDFVGQEPRSGFPLDTEPALVPDHRQLDLALRGARDWWEEILTKEAAIAISDHQLAAPRQAKQVAFEVNALAVAAAWSARNRVAAGSSRAKSAFAAVLQPDPEIQSLP